MKEGKSQRKKRVRKLSIWLKILVPANLVIILVCLAIGITSYNQTASGMVAIGIEQADMAASFAVEVIDGDLLMELEPGDEGGSSYKEILNAMRDVQQTCGIKYMYTLYEDGGQVYYGVDTDDSEEQAVIGEDFEVSYEELEPVFAGDEYVQDYIDSTEDGDLISVYEPIKNSSGKVVAVLGCDYDAAGVVAKLNTVLYRTILMSAVGVVLALLILYFIVRRIMKSLKIVDGKIYELVHNEGDLTQKLDVRSGDELELIANNVNTLLEYIRGIMLNIAANSTKLTGSSKTIVQSLAGSQMNVSDVSATMEEMSAAMEETTASLNEVNEAIRQIYQAIEMISVEANRGSDSSQKITEHTIEIYDNAISNQEKATALAQQMADSVNEKIEKSKAVEKINELTSNIIGITGQTNLLALNASIEAARAGEAGKGFAVVAGEIGKLATDSAEAAAEIQKVSTEVIGAVNQLAAEAEEMLRFMDETAMGGYAMLLETSKNYRSDVENMNQMMQKFATESEQIKANMDHVKESISAVAIAVEETANGVTNVTEMAVDLTNNMQDIGDEANANMEIANKLNEQVNKFKLQ